jgi:hypothetical protein
MMGKEQNLLLFSTMEQPFLHFSVCTLVSPHYAIPAITRLVKSGVYRYYPTTCVTQNGKVKS